MMLNEMTVNMNLQRLDICDLMLACTAAKFNANDGGKKWEKLHDKLAEILKAFDETQGYEWDKG